LLDDSVLKKWFSGLGVASFSADSAAGFGNQQSTI
jgi:hypothetical protein